MSRKPAAKVEPPLTTPPDGLAGELWATLSRREQTFVAVIMTDPKMNQTTAAIAAGYPQRSAKSVGSEIANRPHVASAIAAAQAARVERTMVDADWVLQEAVATYRAARAEPQLAAANSSLGLIAKLQGLLTDKVRVEFRDVSALSDEELAAEAKALGLEP